MPINVRALVLALATVAACGSDSMMGSSAPDAAGGSGDPPPPARGFQVISPSVTIMPGQEVTYCSYFHTPNTETLVIKKWSSVMTPAATT